MAIKIESPEGERALADFVFFYDRIYGYRAARWTAQVPLQLPVLTGLSAFCENRTVKAFLAIEGGEPVARAVAIVDERYIRHWKERIGHIVMFEAMPSARDAVKCMMDEACEWLRGQNLEAARAGFGLLEFPFVIDDYESLPARTSRQNPAYYHNQLKDAGFETEKGWVEYKIEVTPQLVARYQSALEAIRRVGFSVVPLKDVDSARRARDFTSTWNDAFKAHWGVTPFTEKEIVALLEFFASSGGLGTSAIAYCGENPVGVLMATPESTAAAIVSPGHVIGDSQRLNFLGIGVRESARGCGVNLAMASHAYLELIRRGARYLSYTLVLDENWPSRRTAEKLGAKVCANYVVYRRDFRR